MSELNKEEIYNQIIAYFDYTEKLIQAIDHNIDLNDQEIDQIDKILLNLENNFDNLTVLYIEMFKNGYSDQILKNIRDVINNIALSIEHCKNIITTITNNKL